MKISAKELTGVSETLFYPLYMRYRESIREGGKIKSKRYAEIINQIDYDFSELKKLPEKSNQFIACRTIVFDNVTKKFIDENPSDVIVSLGSGLDFRFERIANNTIRWFDIDLPEVIKLRKKLFGENKRSKSISSSILDYSWMDNLPRNRKICFIAEGLFMYFHSKEVEQIIRTLSQRFPDSEIILDATSRFYNFQIKTNKSPYSVLQKIYSMVQWSLDDWYELEILDPGIEFIEEFYPLYGFMDFESEEYDDLPPNIIDIISKSYRIGHLKLGVQPKKNKINNEITLQNHFNEIFF